jgi:hypothetical protein
MTRYLQFRMLILVLFTLIVAKSEAQDRKQSIRGRVLDKESHYPLTGVNVGVYQDTIYIKGSVTNLDGYYRLDSIDVGRYTLRFTYVGYERINLPNIVLSSGKETILNIEMTESAVTLKSTVVKSGGGFETINDMAVVSARNFTAEETERYAGSRQDPARMALNFAGAQATDDSRNDIIVRGNSPLGVLWRYEDVELPNPNHFAVAGSTGGPISVLNNKVIGRSDFMTGAFPAGFGNALSGVFDLRMRNGNNEKHERTFQFGLFGTELSLEGPVSKKKKSSYLIAYRYSTLKIFENINFSLGTSAVPNYQDLTFKFNFPTTKSGTFAIFGLGGTSKIDLVMSKFDEPQDELYGRKDRDQYFRTSMGMVGASHKYHINKNTMSKITLSTSGSNVRSKHELITRNPDFTLNYLQPKLDYKMIETKTSLAWSLRKKINTRNSVIAGFYADAYRFSYHDSIYNEFDSNWNVRLLYQGHNNAIMLQPYFQWNYRARENLTLTGGLHGQYFMMNNSKAVEPRAGAKWEMTPKKSLSFGYGLHSRLQPFYIYFYQKKDANGNLYRHNENMDFTRSHHFVLSYDQSVTKELRVKTEVYYQYIFNVPVELTHQSSFSLLNMGSGFERFFPDELTNTGTGENYGIELTVERTFHKNYFVLLTGSLFESKYRGSDGVLRNTDFNGNFATRMMAGMEKPIGKGNTSLNLGGGITYAGGRRYSPVNLDSSLKSADVVFIDDQRNTLQFKDFFRVDLRIGFKVEAKKVTHEFVLDIINLLDTRNILMLSYDPDIALLNPGANPVREEPQLGRLPVFFYKIHF